MTKQSGIYKIQSKCKPYRIYIGSTYDIPKRWKAHLCALKRKGHHSTKLQRHYNKYGIVDLQFSILLTCEIGDLLKTEQYFIDCYNPYFNECQVAGSVLGRKASLSTIEKMKQRRGNKNPFFGKHHTEETKKA